MRRFLLALLSVLALASCSHPKPPVGRWEGAYDADGTMIAARLEILADGQVRISAPDLLDIGAEDHDAARERLASDLEAEWDQVAPRKMEFDGETFRKPGGIAPQMVWKAKNRQMFLVVYLGTHPSFRIPLREVGDFSENPFS